MLSRVGGGPLILDIPLCQHVGFVFIVNRNREIFLYDFFDLYFNIYIFLAIVNAHAGRSRFHVTE